MNRHYRSLLVFIIILMSSIALPARAATGAIINLAVSTPYPDEPGCTTSYLSLAYTGTYATDDQDGYDYIAAIIFDSQGAVITLTLAAVQPVDIPVFGWAFPFTSLNPIPPGEIKAVLYDLPDANNTDTDWDIWIQTHGTVLDTTTLQEPGAGWFDCGQLAPGGLPFNPQDGRLNPDPAATAVLYAPDDGSIHVYGVDENSHGYLAFYVSAETMAALPDAPEENLQIAQSGDGKISLYKLTTGELQLNTGPDFEGKVFVYIFSGDPLTLVNQYTFTGGA